MATVQTETTRTLADLLGQLGGVSPARVRLSPSPGTASEHDVLSIHGREGRLCELVDGTLVEKAMGFKESCLAVALQAYLLAHVRSGQLGLVSGEAGMLRLSSGLVRIPDVSFVSWDRIPGRRMPAEPIPALAPDLAVEILSEGNTSAEMTRKLREYFEASVRLVWLIDAANRTVTVYQSPDQFTLLTEQQTLDGGEVLPGFSLCLADLFAELDQQKPSA
jgi:Uma2 family endonuclease